MAPSPVVTGLSPIEGPPGTRITIRGENFGTKASDLVGLTICGCDCLMSAEWKSANKIIARSGPGKGKGDVIVCTRLGGVGTCNVHFKGYYEAIGPMKESAVWVEEAALFVWGRHSLSPSPYQHDDPLGLSIEENDKRFPEDDLLENFPNCSGDIAAENFSACWFLLENHHSTSFNDLQAGLLHLRRKVEGQKEGQLSFLKANVGSVMDQIDTIVALKDRFKNDVDNYGMEPSIKLEKCIKEAERDARKLFDDVLSRKDRAEKTRNALNVLARFKFLFCLPCVMDRNIKKGDYDIVINDYMRVKNLFNKTEVPVFKTALAEIEKCIDGLQKMLYQKLLSVPISVDEQKILIRHLVNLDTPNEPVWDAIKGHYNYINLRFKQCYEEHMAAETAAKEEMNKGKLNTMYKHSKQSTFNDSLSAVPENVLFIEDIYELLSELFPDLWKLGQSYFSGELHVKIEPSQQTAFKHMVLTIIETFCITVRSAIIPHTIDKSIDRSTYGIWIIPDLDIIAPWLPTCLQYIRAAYKLLLKLDLPGEALGIIGRLIMDLRVYSIGILFKQSCDHVKQLYESETWKIEYTKKNGVTSLPVKFEQTVQDVVYLIKECILSNEPREPPLLDNPAVQRELDKQIEVLLHAFLDVLKNLAFQDSDQGDGNDCSPIVSQLIGTPVSAYRAYDVSTQMPLWEYRLLATLSNCQYTHKFVLQHIVEIFMNIGYFLSQTAMDSVKSKLIVLEKSILDAYLEQKSDPLVGTIEPSMYLGRFDWDTDIIPHDIRPYAKECINNLINVHSEVYRISPSIVDSVLPQIVQTIAEELYRLMSCVQRFSEAGRQQARADICVLQNLFASYSTSKAKMHFTEALDIIPPLTDSETLRVENLVKQCQSRMKLQILCLSQS